MTIRLTDFEKKQLEQEAERRAMTQSSLLRSFIARLPVRVASAKPNPRDSVQNSSHTHAAHVRCGASFAGQLTLRSRSVTYGQSRLQLYLLIS
ncbi:hypothetical protein [Moorena sp. SIO3I8]|uniref:hypothetical protein n=1 Tax=Moorena sp. SIO3I8 TaxID=2607833 RepID=UPI0025FEAAB4|nr:hypothetical protein [Moorena sp. SIO3I8]